MHLPVDIVVWYPEARFGTVCSSPCQGLEPGGCGVKSVHPPLEVDPKVFVNNLDFRVFLLRVYS